MIDKKTAEVFLNEDVAVKKTDGFTLVGILVEITSSSIILKSKEHGKTAISLSVIDSIEQRKRGEG